MCKAHNLPYAIYKNRKRQGWTLDRIFSVKPGANKKTCVDHNGRTFASQTEMAKFYGIDVEIFRSRVENDWPVKDALTIPIGQNCKVCTDHEGNRYDSITEMCRHWNIDKAMYFSRRKNGWSVKDALTLPRGTFATDTYSITSHDGNVYASQAKMCDAYGIDYKCYQKRIRDGITAEKALTLPKYFKTKCTDPNGVEYISNNQLCKAYGINADMVRGRKRIGWSDEDALTLPKHAYHGEEIISDYLAKHHLPFAHDKQLADSIDADWGMLRNNLAAAFPFAKKNIRNLQKKRLDFVIYNPDGSVNCAVEFDGMQHMEYVKYFFDDVSDFKENIESDLAKEEICRMLNIPLLRIRYDQADSIPEMLDAVLADSSAYCKKHNTYMDNAEYWTPLFNELNRLEESSLAEELLALKA